jgi:hypothetical protein
MVRFQQSSDKQSVSIEIIPCSVLEPEEHQMTHFRNVGVIPLGTVIAAMMMQSAADLRAQDQSIQQRTDQLVQPYLENDIVVGMTIGVLRDGKQEIFGYHSMILVNRQFKTSVVLLTNTATTEVDQLATDILRMISSATVAPRKFEKSINVPTEALKKYIGSYELVPGAVFTVEVKEDKLMIGLTGQPSLQVFP